MKGKVFESSTDVYQDQAKVLFDFYLKAAQKIVDQEDGFDRRCADIDQKIENVRDSNGNMNREYAIGGGLVAAGVILALFSWVLILIALPGVWYLYKSYMRNNDVQGQIDKLNSDKRNLLKEKEQIFKDYKINKIGVVYVPVAKSVSIGDKSVVVDLTGTAPLTTVNLQVANSPDALSSTLKNLTALTTEAPIVEESEMIENVDTSQYSSSIQDVKFYDYFGTMDRTLRTGAYYLSDVSTREINVPFVLPKSDLMNFLNIYATTELEDGVVAPVFDAQFFDEELEEFNKINEFQTQFAQQNTEFEEVLKHLIANVGIAVQTVATLKVASNNKLIDSSNKLLFTILKNSYNHYSPLLEKEEIEKMRNTNFNYSDTVENYKPFKLKASSRVKYDAQTGNWVAEDGAVTTMPFGISQIQEEIVAPIVQNLMAETRVERMRIYNDIRNQKINYLNQWHQDTEDFYGRNRSSSDDLLNIMRSNMTKFIASQTTIESIADIKSNMRQQMISGQKTEEIEDKSDNKEGNMLAAFEVQSQQFRQAQEDFDDYMDRLKEDIDDRARKFEFIEYYDASLRDGLAKDLVTASDEQDQLDSRRRPLVSINPLYAQKSILPPSPSVDESVNEQLSLNVAHFAKEALNDINVEEEFDEDSDDHETIHEPDENTGTDL